MTQEHSKGDNIWFGLWSGAVPSLSLSASLIPSVPHLRYHSISRPFPQAPGEERLLLCKVEPLLYQGYIRKWNQVPTVTERCHLTGYISVTMAHWKALIFFFLWKSRGLWVWGQQQWREKGFQGGDALQQVLTEAGTWVEIQRRPAEWSHEADNFNTMCSQVILSCGSGRTWGEHCEAPITMETSKRSSWWCMVELLVSVSKALGLFFSIVK